MSRSIDTCNVVTNATNELRKKFPNALRIKIMVVTSREEIEAVDREYSQWADKVEGRMPIPDYTKPLHEMYIKRGNPSDGIELKDKDIYNYETYTEMCEHLGKTPLPITDISFLNEIKKILEDSNSISEYEFITRMRQNKKFKPE